MRPRRRRVRDAVLAGLGILLVVACVTGGWAALIAASSGRFDSGASSGGTHSAAGGYHTIYQDSLQTGAGGWAYSSPCADRRDGYHITGAFICFAPVQYTGSVRITVRVEQLSGDTAQSFGIVFRSPSRDNFYRFAIDSNGGWLFSKLTNDTRTDIVSYTPSAAIKPGLNVTNTLQVVARGTHFDFFVNGTKVGEADDGAFAEGRLGLTGVAGGDIVYSDLLVEVPTQ